MDIYDLILLIISIFPGIGPPIIAVASAIGMLVAAATTGVAFGRIVAKLTFWTSKDDEMLERFEAYLDTLKHGRFKPILIILDRLSVLEDVRHPKRE